MARYIVRFEYQGKVQQVGSVWDTFKEAYAYATALMHHHPGCEAWVEQE